MKTKMDKYKAYLGRFFDYWDKVTSQDIENFMKLNIDPAKSYLVIGPLEELNKFTLIFIMQKYYRFEFHTLSNYVFDFKNEESKIIGAELLIIMNISDYMKSENMKEFVQNSLCATIVDRVINNNQTIILSTIGMPDIASNCHEFIDQINLSSYTRVKSSPSDIKERVPKKECNF